MGALHTSEVNLVPEETSDDAGVNGCMEYASRLVQPMMAGSDDDIIMREMPVAVPVRQRLVKHASAKRNDGQDAS